MCGRFTLQATGNALAEYFGLSEEPETAPRYNIAPTQPVAIIRLNRVQPDKREWALTQWGLIPSWAKDPSIGSRMINARSETAAEKPSFRAAYKRRRCLVPMDGFYEWKTLDTDGPKKKKRKQPYYIRMQSSEPFAVAGLWEHWAGADGSELETCTLLTTTPNEVMEPLHHRMPVIVAPHDYDLWLGTELQGADASKQDISNLRHLLRPYDVAPMEAYPVSTYVNNARHEGPTCVEPVSVQETLF